MTQMSMYNVHKYHAISLAKWAKMRKGPAEISARPVRERMEMLCHCLRDNDRASVNVKLRIVDCRTSGNVDNVQGDTVRSGDPETYRNCLVARAVVDRE